MRSRGTLSFKLKPVKRGLAARLEDWQCSSFVSGLAVKKDGWRSSARQPRGNRVLIGTAQPVIRAHPSPKTGAKGWVNLIPVGNQKAWASPTFVPTDPSYSETENIYLARRLSGHSRDAQCPGIPQSYASRFVTSSLWRLRPQLLKYWFS